MEWCRRWSHAETVAESVRACKPSTPSRIPVWRTERTNGRYGVQLVRPLAKASPEGVRHVQCAPSWGPRVDRRANDPPNVQRSSARARRSRRKRPQLIGPASERWPTRSQLAGGWHRAVRATDDVCGAPRSSRTLASSVDGIEQNSPHASRTPRRVRLPSRSPCWFAFEGRRCVAARPWTVISKSLCGRVYIPC